MNTSSLKDKLAYSDLLLIKEQVYDKNGLLLTDFTLDKESEEYSGCGFKLNDHNIKFRKAKITPTKTGQFVTLWKRSSAGITAPYDHTDQIDFVIIAVRKDGKLGQFVFPKAVLIEKSIMTSGAKEGKRGFRVYPPWDVTDNKQASKTQGWQLGYFVGFENVFFL